ncbi:MAG: hypothetical protein V7K94_06050 [Nostoc sp.]|uniref:hypothetical protein n=1 Tax=Nostoc sp. TaxID=1180 RepID=UPI002FF5C488
MNNSKVISYRSKTFRLGNIINYTMSLRSHQSQIMRSHNLELLLYDMLCEGCDRNNCKYFCLST